MYTEQQIIEAHYPLHRLEFSERLNDSLKKFANPLYYSLFKFWSSGWTQFLEPVTLIKRYSGEKFAIYFMYLCNF